MIKSYQNKNIEVCDKCFHASCWYGEIMCYESGGAGTIILTVKELRAKIKDEKLEPESEHYWQNKKLLEVYGDVNPHGYKGDKLMDKDKALEKLAKMAPIIDKLSNEIKEKHGKVSVQGEIACPLCKKGTVTYMEVM